MVKKQINTLIKIWTKKNSDEEKMNSMQNVLKNNFRAIVI